MRLGSLPEKYQKGKISPKGSVHGPVNECERIFEKINNGALSARGNMQKMDLLTQKYCRLSSHGE